MEWSRQAYDDVRELWVWVKGRRAGWVRPDGAWGTAAWCGYTLGRSATVEAAKAAVEAAIWARAAEGPTRLRAAHWGCAWELYCGWDWVGTAYPDGHWYVPSSAGHISLHGQATPPTADAAKAAVEAALWARASEGLGEL